MAKDILIQVELSRDEVLKAINKELTKYDRYAVNIVSVKKIVEKRAEGDSVYWDIMYGWENTKESGESLARMCSIDGVICYTVDVWGGLKYESIKA